MTTDAAISRFVARQKELLELELRSEEGEEKKATSSASLSSSSPNGNGKAEEERPQNLLRGLECAGTAIGLYGRTVVHCCKASGSGNNSCGSSLLLPAHSLGVGDEVEILSKDRSDANGRRSKRNAGGVICSLDDKTISIALFDSGMRGKDTKDDGNDEGDDEFGLGRPPLTVVPRSSVAVHKKMIHALDELSRAGIDHHVAGQIIATIFSSDSDVPGTSSNAATICSCSASATCTDAIANDNRINMSQLDGFQLAAIEFALNCDNDQPVRLIHGPPGTGKTTTVTELIWRAVHEKGWKVLATAPSNVAVDTLLEKLAAAQDNFEFSSHKASRRSKKDTSCSGSSRKRKIRAVRLGHPARIKQSILSYSLESLVQGADGTEIVNDVRSELKSFVDVLANERSKYADRKAALKEIKLLRKEIRVREEAVVADLLSSADVVLATNVGAANSALNKYIEGFDLVVIDEAAQALEASCWIPILRGKRLVLAGDHQQLPPTIKCNDGRVQCELGRTLFEKIMNKRGSLSRMLRTQYRMNALISDWASKASYQNNLISHDSVRDHQLHDLYEGASSLDFPPLLLLDTACCDMHESVNSAGSRFNEGEARIVAAHIQALLAIGMNPKEIAVISPYNGQVELLRSLLLPAVPGLEVRTVDGFQGGEREAVVLSLVRSSPGGASGIGFLRDERRLNVAITRARRNITVICDSDTVSRNSFIKNLINWMEERGEHRSAAEMDPENAGPTYSSIVGKQTGLNSGKMLEGSTSIRRDSDLRRKGETKKTVAKPAKRSKGQGDEERRQKIMDNIGKFAGTSQGDQKMTVGTNLSKFDEIVACELAKQLGLEFKVKGKIGLDRQLVVWKSNEEAPSQIATAMNADEDGNNLKASVPVSSFAALDVSDGSDSDSDSKGAGDVPSGNALLAGLARERIERKEQEKQQGKSYVPQSNHLTNNSTGNNRGKKKKKKNKSSKSNSAAAKAGGNNQGCAFDGEDNDMAFLDAQVKMVQTSHGRKVEGSGKAYKSIINGVLLAKPEPRAPKTNVKASNALKEKLKKQGDDRKGKAKGKKKK